MSVQLKYLLFQYKELYGKRLSICNIYIYICLLFCAFLENSKHLLSSYSLSDIADIGDTRRNRVAQGAQLLIRKTNKSQN